MNPKYGYALHCVACDAPLAAAIEETMCDWCLETLESQDSGFAKIQAEKRRDSWKYFWESVQ